MTDPRLSEELAKVRGSDRVKLSAYCLDNLEWFREQRRRRVPWVDLAATVTNLDLRDANGRAPSANTLRVTIRRLERRFKRERQGRVGRPANLPAAEPRHSSELFKK
jgi:hypothetical protein